MAKEVTVDFNRRGEWGTAMNAMYLFYNASIQGSARMLRAMLDPRNKRLRKLVAGTVAFAAAQDVLNRTASSIGDDDDERSDYDRIPDHVKDRNLIIWDLTGKHGERLLQDPTPLGLQHLPYRRSGDRPGDFGGDRRLHGLVRCGIQRAPDKRHTGRLQPGAGR
jgi:hypothetical protein